MSTNLISISNNSSNNNNQQSIEDDNPNLFWLPARLHPEIAPQEFKAFIEEATRPENLLRRTSSAFGSRKPLIDQSTGAHSNTDSSLSRKKSMLSKVYDPDEEDSNQSNPLPKLSSSSSSSSSLSSSSRSKNDPSEITRGSSMYYRSGAGRGLNGLESLTINDLQRLESLVLKKQLPSSLNYSTLMESSEGNIEDADSPGNRIKAVIRRSMSLANPPPSSGFEIPQELGLEAIDDSPLIARGPGHIIRRTARTKVRKTSLPGDGNGHRFPATRRTKLRSPSRSSPNSSKSSSTPISTSKTEPLTPSLPQALSNNQLEPDHEPSCAVYNDDLLRTGLTLETKLVNTELSARVSPYSSSSPVSSSNTNSKAHHPHPTGATTPPQTKSNRQSDQTTVSTEDDFALNSRPDSMSSNSSLLDAYIDQSASLDDNPTPTTQSGDFESKLSGSSPDQLFQSPVSSNLVIERFAGKVSKHSSNKSSGAIDSNPSLSTAVNLSPQTPQSIPPTRSQSQSPSNDSPNNMKMGGVKVMTNMMVKSAEELVSSSRNSADSYFSGMNMGSDSRGSSSEIPLKDSSVGKVTSRPAVKSTKPSSISFQSPNDDGSDHTDKVKKEKKRGAWGKLGLSSSSSEKSKKEKGKDKTPKVMSGAKDKQENSPAAGGANKQTALGLGSSGAIKQQASPTAAPAKKESGFLSGLFGSKSKKQDQDQDKQNQQQQGKQGNQMGSVASGGSNSTYNKSSMAGGGSIANQMMYGTNAQHQQMMMINPTASGGFIKGKYTSFYRLPIHVERAVYRLSHIKLANPRRPLYEQVLISNLMFWYLGVINKTQPLTSAGVSGPNSNQGVENSGTNLASGSRKNPTTPSTTSNQVYNRNQSAKARKDHDRSSDQSAQKIKRDKKLKGGSGKKSKKSRKKQSLGGVSSKSTSSSARRSSGDRQDEQGSSFESSSFEDRENSSSNSASNTDEDESMTTEENEEDESGDEDEEDTEGEEEEDEDEDEDNNDDDDDDDEKPLGSRVKLRNTGGEGNWLNGRNNINQAQNLQRGVNGKGSGISGGAVTKSREPGHGSSQSRQKQPVGITTSKTTNSSSSNKVKK